MQGEVRSAVSNIAGLYNKVKWYLPMAVGNHLDHRLVRDVTLSAIREALVPMSQVHFYEDLPYADKLGGSPDFSGKVPGMTLRPELIDIEDVCSWKMELGSLYWSQIRRHDVLKLVDYAIRVGSGRAAERVWQV